MNLVIDTHCHTVSSGHAYSTLKECLFEANSKGLEALAITDHAPAITSTTNNIYFLNLSSLPETVYDVKILKGVELNILDYEGTVDLEDRIFRKLDIVIASLHLPCIKPSTVEDNTNAILGVMDNQYINIIGHLCDPRYPFDIQRVVSKAKEKNIALELNNASLNPTSIRYGDIKPYVELLECCKKENVFITTGSDSHFFDTVGQFNYIQELLDITKFPEELVLNTSIEKLNSIIRNKDNL